MPMRIGDLVREKLIAVGNNFVYPLDYDRSYDTNPEATGCESQKLFTRDSYDHIDFATNWGVYHLYSNGDIDIARLGHAPFFGGKIMLSGLKAYQNAPEEINRMCEALFSNAKYGAVARAKTLEECMAEYHEKYHKLRKRAFYSPLLDSVWGSIRYQGQKYEKKECFQIGYFYEPDGGGKAVSDKEGNIWYTATKGNPVYVSEKGFSYELYGKNDGGGWLPSRAVWFDDIPNKHNLIGGDVCYGMNTENSVIITRKTLFNSATKVMKVSSGLLPVVHLSGDILVDVRTELRSSDVGSGWNPEYWTIFSIVD